MQPEVLDKPTDVYDLPALSESPKSYVVYNDNKPREYYILRIANRPDLTSSCLRMACLSFMLTIIVRFGNTMR